MGCHVSVGKRTKSAIFLFRSNYFNLLNFPIISFQKGRTMNQDIIKSPSDKNLYKTLVLNNGLRVLLIHTHIPEYYKEDPSVNNNEQSDGENEGENHGQEMCVSDTESISSEESSVQAKKDTPSDVTKMAAAALCIGVGCFHDPPELPGLAHFLEHMIFMGSKKYPKENHYDSFISTHGGSDNAYTLCERTVFHMDITPKCLKEALDIFANCFVSPLLHPDSMDREIEAVDSEFELRVAVDDERSEFILSSLAKPGHPMAKFKNGNKISLKDEPEKLNINVNEALHKFQQKYYSAHRMTLAVQSAESLETMEDWVTKLFSVLPNNSLPVMTFEDLKEPFKTDSFHKFYKVVPVKAMDRMFLTWALPAVEKHYKSKPLEYLAFLVGHEGKGSILTYLRKRCWATSVIAGTENESGFEMNTTGSLFSVIVVLTELGMDHQFDVLTAIFQYLEMLRSNGPQERYFTELKIVSKTSFFFQEQEDPNENVAKLSEQMQLYPVEHYLCGDKLYFEYDPKIISECLDLLKPCNVNIMVLSSRYTEADCQTVEHWTKCKYSCCDIPDDWLTSWKDLADNQELFLPEPNKFLATNFDLKHHREAENNYPVKILDDEISCIWFKEDVKFQTPRAYIRYLICTPKISETAEGAAMGDLFILLLTSFLAEEAYPALMADLYYQVLSMSEGFLIVVNGFDHKLNLLLETVLDHILQFDPNEATFQSMKNRLLQICSNYMINPDKLAKELEVSVLRNAIWTSTEKMNAVKSVTRLMLKNFVQQCFETFFLESFFQGNLTKEEVLSMDKMIRDKMNPNPLSNEQRLKRQVTELPVGTSICRVVSPAIENQNTVIVNSYQLGPYNLKSSCMITLLTEFMSEPCFDVLRTQEQLGYDVSCVYDSLWGIFSIKISVQSPSNKFCYVHIDNRIEEFLKNCLKNLEEMDQEKFETQHDSLVQCKKCDDLNLDEENMRFWKEIMYHRYVFDRKEREVEYLENLSLDEFKEWLSRELTLLLHKKRKLSVQVVGPCDEIVGKMNDFSSVEANEQVETSDSQVPKQRNNKPLKFLIDCSQNDTTHFISDTKNFKASLPFYSASNVDS